MKSRKQTVSKKIGLWTVAVVALAVCWSPLTGATVVTLTQGTATGSQPGFSPDAVVDGIIPAPSGTVNGWATGGGGSAQTAVWETASDVTANLLNFTLYHRFLIGGSPTGGKLLLGGFRLSVTDANRSTFADGADNGGDVTTSWTVLGAPLSVTLPAGMTYSVLGDNSILTAGTIPQTGDYQLSFAVPNGLGALTGVRLEALTNATLPNNGPGWASASGNLVLAEMQLEATMFVPEPSAVLLLGVGGCLLWRRRRRA